MTTQASSLASGRTAGLGCGRMEEIMSVDVYRWAQTARAGQRVVYARHRLGDPYGPDNLGPAYNAHLSGLVFLAQRRIPGGFEYEATRISPEVAKRLRHERR